MDEDKTLIDEKKKALLAALGKVVYKKRKEIGKGINRFSFEYDIGNGLLSRLENGKIDIKITTFWKLANALNLNLKDFVEEVEKELPKGFNFYL